MFENRIAKFKDEIRALVRTSDPEQRKKLPIPWEFRLWHKCKNKNVLPFAGGVLDQPHIIMMSFDIIENEIAIWENEQIEKKRQLDEVNEKLKQAHQRKNG